MNQTNHLPIVPFIVKQSALKESEEKIFYRAPISNIEIKPGSKIYVDYDLDDEQRRKLSCKVDPSDAITSVEWAYKHVPRRIELPVVLKDEKKYKGHYADTYGKLVITNEFGSHRSDGIILVSCEYQSA